MDISLPPPLLDPACDCRGLPFMPLEATRLRESDLAALSTGDEFKAAVLLWCASWTQVPAASLPDDERILARLSGYNLADFRGLREMAMRGWVKCSDGRLYHALIADLAAAAWEKRKGQKAKAESRWARSKSRSTPERMPPLAEADATAHAPAMQGTVEVEGKNPPTPLQGDEHFQNAWSAYPVEGRANLSLKVAIEAWHEAVEHEGPGSAPRLVQAAIARAAEAAKANSRPRRFDRWLKGREYAAHLPAPGSSPHAWPGPPDIRAALVTAQGRDWAEKWLDRCGWRDVPIRALVAPSQLVADRLARDAGSDLRALGLAVVLEQAA